MIETISVRSTMLNLPAIEKRERKKMFEYYMFYKGKCRNKDLAKAEKIFLGQSWETNDNVGYTPIQDIRNKVKPLLKKQARFMFGATPEIMLKPNNLLDNEPCEELRRFIDDILEDNQFWKDTRKAFLMSTIKKRVLLRVEANPGIPNVIKYENIDDFFYDEKNGHLLKVVFFQEDDKNALTTDDTKKKYYLYTYYYDTERQADGTAKENSPITAWFKKQSYTNGEYITEEETVQDTGFNTIPCWLIKNGGELNDDFGESDLEDLVDPQMLYNKKNSDFADALRFQMFGTTAIIDGKKEDVDELTIAPNSLQAIRTDDKAAEGGKQASITRQEYSMGNSTAVNAYLDRVNKDMRDMLDMPDISDLSNIASAKAMKYLYNDLIARCEEKWSDWEPIFKQMINFIINAAAISYPNFKKSWLGLDYTIVFKHNYPLPDDEDDKKTIGMAEVNNKVRSIRSYIKEFTDEEDSEKTFNDILEETSQLSLADGGTFQIDPSVKNETNLNSNSDNNATDPITDPKAEETVV